MGKGLIQHCDMNRTSGPKSGICETEQIGGPVVDSWIERCPDGLQMSSDLVRLYPMVSVGHDPYTRTACHVQGRALPYGDVHGTVHPRSLWVKSISIHYK